MKKFLLTLLLLPLSLHAAPTDSVQMRLSSFFRSLAAYDNQFSQEKVYLHLDNTAYFAGETLWFKAYVTRASSLTLTDLSKVLYVELLDEYGELVERKNYEIDSGQCEGHFALDKLLHSGFYEIRAYTRAQLNWDGAYVYSRVVPIFDEPGEKGDYSRPTLFTPSPDSRQPSTRPEPDAGKDKRGKGARLFAEFYPEGGWAVKGHDALVAFKVWDKKGRGDNLQGTLHSADGTALRTFRPEHEGMGSFLWKAEEEGAYVTFKEGEDGKESTFTLPERRDEGCALHMEENGDSLSLDLWATPHYWRQRLGVSVTCRGSAAYFTTLTFTAPRHTLRIARRSLHDGINQITLFTAEGEILAERMVWNDPSRTATLLVRQNEEEYKPFSPIVLDLQLQSATGRPAEAYLSLSVRESSGEANEIDESLSTDLLLSSDIRGYVAAPDYYFNPANADRRHALDLLLLVQGYRRYAWKEMAGVEPLKVTQPVEEGQLIKGNILSADRKRLAEKDVDLSLLIMAAGCQAIAVTKTKKDGSFALMPEPYYGMGWGTFGTHKDGKLKNYRIRLDRNFEPDLRPISPREKEWVYPTWQRTAEKKLPREDILLWEDTISRGTILLAAAGIKGKDNSFSTRFMKNGGEEAARNHSTIYYNIEDVTRRIMDTGEDVPLIWDWLKEHNSDFDYSLEADTGGNVSNAYTYFGRPVPVTVNNDFGESEHRNLNIDMDRLLTDEVKAIYISVDRAEVKKMYSMENPGQIDNDRAAIYVFTYDIDNPTLEKKRKGIRVTTFKGYEPAHAFEGPDYYKIDRPDPNDFRRTLYWNPDVLTDKDGHASVIFYSNARAAQRLHITARSVLPDGSLLDFSR